MWCSPAGACWHFLTRLGESQNLLPAVLVTCLALLQHFHTRRFALAWLAALGLGAALTLLTKVAFIGWGIGITGWNFTGISGHAMMAAATYPLLAAVLTARCSRHLQIWAVIASLVIVLAVAVSRVMLHTHSVSEVVAGMAVGSAVSAWVIANTRLPHLRLSHLVPAVVVAWLLVTPLHAPQLPTHALVIKLALYLSGHQYPYTRSDLFTHKVGIIFTHRHGHATA